MKKRMWKVMALLMAGTMALGACGQAESGESEEVSESSVPEKSSVEEQESSYFNATGLPIVNEEITLKILAVTNANASGDYEDMKGWKYLSEVTGIKFEFEEYTSEDMATKLPLIMSDPDAMPDIFWNVGMSAQNIIDYGEQGLLTDMTELIEQYGENIKTCWEVEPLNKSYATATNGAVYALPAYNYTGTPTGVWSFQVNNRWMENCGITEYPSDLNEFKNMLIKFRDMDANGNGDPADEIPMMGNQTSLYQVLGAAFDMPLDWPWVGVAYGAQYGTTEAQPLFMTENYRAMIEYMSELFAEGLVNQDLFSVSGDENNARRFADRYGVMCNTTNPNAEEKYNPDEWDSIPLLASEYVKDPTAYAYVTPSYQSGMAIINAKTEYPEACIRLLDYCMSMDGTALFCGAIHNGTYDLEAAGVSQEIIDMYEEEYKVTGDAGMSGYNIVGNYGCIWRYQFSEYQIEGAYESHIKETYARVQEVYKGKEFYNPTHTISFSAEEQEAVSTYKTDIDTYVKETVARWFACEEELNDETWNAYIEKLESMHVDKLTEAYVSAHNRFFGVE